MWTVLWLFVNIKLWYAEFAKSNLDIWVEKIQNVYTCIENLIFNFFPYRWVKKKEINLLWNDIKS